MVWAGMPNSYNNENEKEVDDRLMWFFSPRNTAEMRWDWNTYIIFIYIHIYIYINMYVSRQELQWIWSAPLFQCLIGYLRGGASALWLLTWTLL